MGTSGDTGLTRRRFIEQATAGAAGFAGIAGLAYAGRYLGMFPEVTIEPPAVVGNQVDYSQVPATVASPTLRVAQWYDYWPGSFLENFRSYIRTRYGVTIDVLVDVYTSNEELYAWVTLTGRKYDVVFPTNDMVERMERERLLLNLNPDWLPNYSHLYAWARDPVETPWAFRGSVPIAVPYQWGTTGIGFRTGMGWTRDDVLADGHKIFWMDSYKGVDLRGKKMLLDAPRDTIGVAYKYLGWVEQESLGFTPTGIPHNPAPPYNGAYQWSVNEKDDTKLAAARDALIAVKPSLLGFNTANQGPYLANEIVYIDTAWSGDIMYAIRPHTSSPKPIDYVVPLQGGARWMDYGVIPKYSTNLFLAHELVNYFLDPVQGARITDWNLYATPNESAFDLVTAYPQYNYDPREDPRIYCDYASGYTGPSILERTEWIRDLGAEWTAKYLEAWAQVRFG